MDITPILDHLKEYAVLYALGAVCVIPTLVITRRWSVPLILYAVEIAIYLGLMHVGVGVITRVAAWFKDQSSMKRAFDIREAKAPGWATPWIEFWDIEQYHPEALLYVEIVVAVIIVFLVWRIRPLRVKRRQAPPSKKAEQYVRSKGAPMPGRGGNR
ncbi:MAG TPA: hypothetical protein PKI11_00420 [Candidatus Hydrogenedentes bacterium]|nr:hypothetical protein [Candidatus Hydrogenedentota bacterium]HNT86392.1 hypothetical protein [Candidatus Hydrogenedentota bacterium]